MGHLDTSTGNQSYRKSKFSFHDIWALFLTRVLVLWHWVCDWNQILTTSTSWFQLSMTFGLLLHCFPKLKTNKTSWEKVGKLWAMVKLHGLNAVCHRKPLKPNMVDVCIYIYTHTHMYIYTYVYTRVYTVNISRYVYIYIHMYIRAYMYIICITCVWRWTDDHPPDIG